MIERIEKIGAEFDRARIPDALALPDLPEFLRTWALDHQT